MSLTDFTSSSFKPVGTHALYCRYCDKNFRSFASYTKHIETEHHIVNKTIPKRSCVPDWEDKKDICDGRLCYGCIIL